MTENFEFKDRYDCSDLLRIVEILRAPGGCPWDREQTHESIRSNFIEETYEVIEAINKKDPAMLREELGDVMLQVALHSVMEQEKGAFTFNDVCDEICKKLIVRHPHVFGETVVHSTDEVLSNWETIKMQTKAQKTASQAIDAVPREFPALMRAQKVQKKAAKVGFDWDAADGVLDKIVEETAEVREALGEGPARRQEEIGDLLFSVVNLCRFAHVDAEESLTAATDKFAARFRQVEALAAARGLNMPGAGLEALDALWNEVKAAEKAAANENNG